MGTGVASSWATRAVGGWVDLLRTLLTEISDRELSRVWGFVAEGSELARSLLPSVWYLFR